MQRQKLPDELKGLAEWLDSMNLESNARMVRRAASIVKKYAKLTNKKSK